MLCVGANGKGGGKVPVQMWNKVETCLLLMRHSRFGMGKQSFSCSFGFSCSSLGGGYTYCWSSQCWFPWADIKFICLLMCARNCKLRS